GVPWVHWMLQASSRQFLWNIMLAVVVVVPFAMIERGVSALHSPNSKKAAIAEAVSHGIGWLGLVAILYGVLPTFERIFREFEVGLPATTSYVVQTAHVVARFPDLAMPFVILLVPADVAIFWWLHASPKQRAWARVWSASITLL